ncbi:hypothetical protein [Phenylobacterium sp.]|uniref:hypothetical protein n=1 Tax=Phenylobacterium sp. TaxID=1871053 RepID=UPI002810F4A6|nr:hypothetical protein [Phenylobacterium sp.]
MARSRRLSGISWWSPWDTVEDHTVRFRSSPAFDRWRALAGPHFGGPPQVSHVGEVPLD